MSLSSAIKLFLIAMLLLLQPSGCYNPPDLDSGGADELITIHMPFEHGYQAMCTQGVGGSYSHQGNATRHDLDFDTPNDRRDIIYAPVAGVAHVHDDPNNGFGRHVNIDLGDRTYIVLGHLDQILIPNETHVGLGQVIGFEGNTGNSSGDHLHMGRHEGFASQTANFGESIPTLALISEEVGTGQVIARQTNDFRCALPGGKVYRSSLPDVKSYPNGSLIKSPHDADVFLVENGRRRLYEDEDTFWADHRSFREVINVHPGVMDYYPEGAGMPSYPTIGMARAGGEVWLLLEDTDQRVKIPGTIEAQVTQSWGMVEADVQNTNAQSLARYMRVTGPSLWRDGTIIREASRSDVYILQEGIAFPVLNWDVFTRLGLGLRPMITLGDGLLQQYVRDIGNCSTGTMCVDHAFAESCGTNLAASIPSQGSQPVEEDEGDPGDTQDIEDDEDPPESEDTEGDVGGQGPVDTAQDPPPGGGGANPGNPHAPTSAPLTITWRMPGNVTADRITLSGVYAPQGVEGWWSQLNQVASTSQLSYTQPGMESGDHLRFSVEYQMGSSVSWSCLAPFPPGNIQGVAAASWNGQSLPVLPAGDPAGSPGCGLKVTIP